MFVFLQTKTLKQNSPTFEHVLWRAGTSPFVASLQATSPEAPVAPVAAEVLKAKARPGRAGSKFDILAKKNNLPSLNCLILC